MIVIWSNLKEHPHNWTSRKATLSSPGTAGYSPVLKSNPLCYHHGPKMFKINPFLLFVPSFEFVWSRYTLLRTFSVSVSDSQLCRHTNLEIDAWDCTKRYTPKLRFILKTTWFLQVLGVDNSLSFPLGRDVHWIMTSSVVFWVAPKADWKFDRHPKIGVFNVVSFEHADGGLWFRRKLHS